MHLAANQSRVLGDVTNVTRDNGVAVAHMCAEEGGCKAAGEAGAGAEQPVASEEREDIVPATTQG